MNEPSVIRCPPQLRPAALRRLHAANDSAQQEGLAQALAVAEIAGNSAFDGLFVAGAPPKSACWVQRTAGNTALVWPPEPQALESPALLRSAAQFVDEAKIAVAQINVGEADGFDADVMRVAGFAQLARLLYLYADVARAKMSATISSAECEFVGDAASDPAGLAALIEATYSRTLDCPALDHVRTTEDVIAGYQAQGDYLPQHWYRVIAPNPKGRPSGVLILASHAATGNWELVYMGVVPQARGQQLGRRIVEFALETAAHGGAERLVLAVDADNRPAVDMYRAAGFVEWDRRTVFARLAKNANVSRGA